VIKKTFISCILIIGILSILASLAWSSSAKEESADRGKYVAEQGKIIPPEEIHIDSYILKPRLESRCTQVTGRCPFTDRRK
jgi:hypothetical protein